MTLLAAPPVALPAPVWWSQLPVLLRMGGTLPLASLWMLSASAALWAGRVVIWAGRLPGWLGRPRVHGRPG